MSGEKDIYQTYEELEEKVNFLISLLPSNKAKEFQNAYGAPPKPSAKYGVPAGYPAPKIASLLDFLKEKLEDEDFEKVLTILGVSKKGEGASESRAQEAISILPMGPMETRELSTEDAEFYATRVFGEGKSWHVKEE